MNVVDSTVGTTWGVNAEAASAARRSGPIEMTTSGSRPANSGSNQPCAGAFRMVNNSLLEDRGNLL